MALPRRCCGLKYHYFNILWRGSSSIIHRSSQNAEKMCNVGFRDASECFDYEKAFRSCSTNRGQALRASSFSSYSSTMYPR